MGFVGKVSVSLELTLETARLMLLLLPVTEIMLVRTAGRKFTHTQVDLCELIGIATQAQA